MFEVPQNIGLRSLRIFISYANKEAEIAGILKVLLEERGFEVFIAHNDIEPSVEWQEEIIRNLKRCDIFIPIISTNFKNSDWTDQETGIAVCENKHIVPIHINIIPYGFIEKYQSLKVDITDIGKVANSIFNTIVENSKFGNEMKDFAINTLLSSYNFDQANTRANSLKLFRKFSKEQIERLVKGTLINNQIYDGWNSKLVLRKIFTDNEDFISKEDFIKLMNLLKD